MRYTKEKKEAVRDRIVDVAAREYRRHGIEGLGIAKLMQSAGLTHGTFYSHFESKEELVREAMNKAFMEGEAGLFGDQSNENADPPSLRMLIESYLSPEHVMNPDFGCPMAANACDVSRASLDVRQSFTEVLKERLDRYAELAPGLTKSARQDHVMVLMSLLVGAVQGARISTDPALSARILEAAREFALHWLAGERQG